MKPSQIVNTRKNKNNNKNKTKHRKGYARDQVQRRWIEPTAVEPAPPPKPRIPLVPGIRQALNAMTDLSWHLEPILGIGNYTVSVDQNSKDQVWVLVVRGEDPFMEFYQGYEVKHVKSTLVRCPHSRGMKATRR